MASIHIRREHDLGLAEARRLASTWTQDATARFGLTCRVTETDAGDVVEFARPGASGRLDVRADHFTIDAKLGLLLGGFARKIQSEIEAHLDAMLARRGPARR